MLHEPVEADTPEESSLRQRLGRQPDCTSGFPKELRLSDFFILLCRLKSCGMILFVGDLTLREQRYV